MAEATVVNLYADSVVGDMRCRKVTLDLAGTGDIYTATGFAVLFGAIANPPSTTNVFASVATNVATFTYAGGGAMAAVDVMLFGI